LKRGAAAIVLLVAGLLAYAGGYEVRHVVLERVVLPGGGPHLVIGQISDVDFRGLGVRERRAREILQTRVHPDLVAVTGDLLEFRHEVDADRALEAIEYLESLPAPLGIYWVAGESEARHLDSLRSLVAGRRLRLLNNEEVRLPFEGTEVSLFGLGRNEARFEAVPGAPGIRAHAAGLFSPLVDASPEAASWRDYRVEGMLRFEDAEDYVGVLAYVPPSGGWGYGLLRHRDQRAFHLRRFGGASELEWEVANGSSFPPGTPLRYELEVGGTTVGNRIRARVWEDGVPRPEGWDLVAWDRGADRPASGAAGVCVKGGGDERYFGPWTVVDSATGARIGGRGLEAFDATDGTWRFRSVLRDWAPAGDGPRPTRILLAHNPDVVLEMEAQGVGPVDLVLAGHTQGGQVRLPWFGALYTGTELGRRHAAGLSRYHERLLYVNRGLGTSLVPIRFLAAPEVTALELPLAGGRAEGER
jgi:predicted MPP superfamily phosphohydrolase